MTVIERAARAMLEARPENAHGIRFEHALILAAAVIRAIRDPSEDMIAAVAGKELGFGPVGACVGRESAIEDWQAMIDVALERPPDG